MGGPSSHDNYYDHSSRYPTHTHTHTHVPDPGIGRHAALHLADQGGFLVFAGVRRPEDGEALRAKAAHPERVVPVILDVTKPVRATGRLGWRVLPQVCLDYGMQLSVDDVSFLLSPYMTHTGSNRRGAR